VCVCVYVCMYKNMYIVSFFIYCMPTARLRTVGIQYRYAEKEKKRKDSNKKKDYRWHRS
jgi:hypothetical protein